MRRMPFPAPTWSSLVPCLIVQSYSEGLLVEDGDPWSLKDDGLATQEWIWFEDEIETQLATDGGWDRCP